MSAHDLGLCLEVRASCFIYHCMQTHIKDAYLHVLHSIHKRLVRTVPALPLDFYSLENPKHSQAFSFYVQCCIQVSVIVISTLTVDMSF